MDKDLTLKATKRDITGRKVKTLRAKGILPANIFGKGVDSIAVSIDAKTFSKLYQEIGESTLLKIDVEGSKTPISALVSDVDIDPLTNEISHASLRAVSLKEKIKTYTSLEFVGESPAVKEKGAVLLTTLDEVEIEALPTDLPEHIEVDISILVELGDQITAGSLKLPTGVELVTEAETVVAIAQEHVEEVEEEVATPTEAETTVQGKPAETTEEPKTE